MPPDAGGESHREELRNLQVNAVFGLLPLKLRARSGDSEEDNPSRALSPFGRAPAPAPLSDCESSPPPQDTLCIAWVKLVYDSSHRLFSSGVFTDAKHLTPATESESRTAFPERSTRPSPDEPLRRHG